MSGISELGCEEIVTVVFGVTTLLPMRRDPVADAWGPCSRCVGTLLPMRRMRAVRCQNHASLGAPTHHASYAVDERPTYSNVDDEVKVP